jgi:hypothetical protein
MTEDLSTFIAPWALPGEIVPLYVEWKPIKDGEPRFVVELPEGSKFIRATNVRRMTRRGTRISISAFGSDGYFGLHFATPKIQKEIMETREIKIIYALCGGARRHQIVRFPVVRPKLEIINCPGQIAVNDDVDLSSILQLSLRQLGSGFVKISITVDSGGRILSSHEDIIWRFLRAAIEKGILSQKELEEKKKEYGIASSSVKVSDEFIRKLEQEINTTIEQLPQLSQGFNTGMASELAEALKTVGPKKIVELLTENMELFLTGELIRTFNKYPGDKSMLIGGKTTARLSKSLDTITITVRYEDSMGNEYEPIQCNIQVIDERQQFKGEFIPVNIEVKKAWFQSLPGGIRSG